MIQLEYSFTKKYIDTERLVKDYSDFNASAVEYRFAEGNINYKINNKDFSAEWEWVPLLGFALNHYLFLSELPQTLESTFEYTENGLQIHYKYIDSKVRVSANYGPNAGEETTIDYDELKTAFINFFKKVYSDILKEIPQFESNKYMKELFDKYPELKFDTNG